MTVRFPADADFVQFLNDENKIDVFQVSNDATRLELQSQFIAKLQNDREREKQAMQQQIAAEVAKQTAHLREQFKQLKASAVTTQQATNFTSTEAVKDLIKADKILSRMDKILLSLGLIVAIVGAILAFFPEDYAIKMTGAALTLVGVIISAVAAHKLVFPATWQKYLKAA